VLHSGNNFGDFSGQLSNIWNCLNGSFAGNTGTPEAFGQYWRIIRVAGFGIRPVRPSGLGDAGLSNHKAAAPNAAALKHRLQ
jgi:hypothetical protein